MKLSLSDEVQGYSYRGENILRFKMIQLSHLRLINPTLTNATAIEG